MAKITRKVRVYIASPFNRGSQLLNIRFQAQIFNEMTNDGIAFPVLPLAMAHFHMIYPRPEQDWLKYNLGLMEMCDCVLRLPATCDMMPEYVQVESSGADGEVARALELNMPVFYSKGDLYDFCHAQSCPF